MKALLLLASLWLAAPQTVPQGQTPLATGTISGVVLVSEFDTPLTGAVVHLNRPDANPDLVLDLNRKPTISTSNEKGRFGFSDLPAGKYSIWMEAPPEFVWRDYRIYDGAVQVTVDPVQNSEDVIFKLIPRGSISGRVLSDKGEPLVGAAVSAVCVIYREGKRGLESCGGVQQNTDLEGNYRLFWLAPGKYYIRTEYHPSTDDSPPLVYFPGTLDEAQAISVDVKPGSHLRNLDFSLVAPPNVPSYTVSGKVTGLPPMAADIPIARLYLRLHDGSAAGTYSFFVNTAGDNSGGRFQIRGVRSGKYELWTQVRDESGLSHTARTSIEVADSNVEGVVVGVLPVAELHGRVLIDGKPPATPFSPSFIPISIRSIDFPLEFSSFQLFGSKGIEFNRETGEFTIRRMPLGRYKVTFYSPNGHVADIRQGNQSIFESVVISETMPPPIEVFISSQGGTIDGLVTGADLNPVLGATIAIVSVPDAGREAVWTDGIMTDKAGHFSMSRLSPGQYQIYAWMNPPTGDPWRNPEFMRRYEPLGQSLLVNPGSKTAVRLTAIPEDK